MCIRDRSALAQDGLILGVAGCGTAIGVATGDVLPTVRAGGVEEFRLKLAQYH